MSSVIVALFLFLFIPCFVPSPILLILCVLVPAILNEAVPATTQNVDVEIQQTALQAFKYTTMAERIINGETKEGPSLQLLKEALINSRQHEAFLRIILVITLIITQ